jgi:hypothetical protein
LAGQLAVSIIEMEITRQLVRTEFAGIAAVSPYLFGGEE